MTGITKTVGLVHFPRNTWSEYDDRNTTPTELATVWHMVNNFFFICTKIVTFTAIRFRHATWRYKTSTFSLAPPSPPTTTGWTVATGYLSAKKTRHEFSCRVRSAGAKKKEWTKKNIRNSAGNLGYVYGNARKVRDGAAKAGQSII